MEEAQYLMGYSASHESSSFQKPVSRSVQIKVKGSKAILHILTKRTLCKTFSALLRPLIHSGEKPQRLIESNGKSIGAFTQ